MKELLSGNLGVHLTLNPAGTWSFGGALPFRLGDVIPASQQDVMAGRAFRNLSGKIVTVHFPRFANRADGVAHAVSRNVDLCAIPTCACNL